MEDDSRSKKNQLDAKMDVLKTGSVNVHIELPQIPSFNDKSLSFMIKPGTVVVLLCEDEILTEGILMSIGRPDYHADDVIKVQNSKKHFCLYIPSDPSEFFEKIGFSEEMTIGDLYYSVSGLTLLEKRMVELEQQMAMPSCPEVVINEYGEMATYYSELNGYQKVAWASEILTRLGLSEDGITVNTQVKHASSGQKSKILLGMGIFAKPTILVLDNVFPHLDSDSKEWLAEYLNTTESGVILAAYEEETPFLDKVADISVIIEYGFGYTIDGSVSHSRTILDQVYSQQSQEARVFKSDLVRREEVINERRNNPKFTRSRDAIKVVMAQYRRAQRDREILHGMIGHVREQAMGKVPSPQRFQIIRESGNSVLKVRDPLIRYGHKIGFDLPKLELDIRRNDRIAILGPNGSGKSTLSRAMVQSFKNPEYVLERGEIIIGSDLDIGYFSPDLLYDGRIRRARSKVLDFAVQESGLGEASRNNARSCLAYWGFSKEEMEGLQVARLGRRAKTQLSLAILMMMKPNLLILDEPTADLPETMVDRLLESLKGYPGTLLIISHEDAFIKSIRPNKILDLSLKKVIKTDYK